MPEHIIAGGYSETRCNPKSVTVKKTRLSLRVGKIAKISAKVSKLIPGKKLMTEHHAPKVRFWSGNKKVATVSASGMIKAKGKGSCNVYAIAQNGAYATVKVTVK